MALKAHVSVHSRRIQSIRCEAQFCAWASIRWNPVNYQSFLKPVFFLFSLIGRCPHPSSPTGVLLRPRSRLYVGGGAGWPHVPRGPREGERSMSVCGGGVSLGLSSGCAEGRPDTAHREWVPLSAAELPLLWRGSHREGVSYWENCRTSYWGACAAHSSNWSCSLAHQPLPYVRVW